MASSGQSWERLDAEAVAAGQLKKLKALLEKTAASNGFYRERWRAAGVDVATIDSLDAFAARVPMVEKKDFIEDQAAHPPYGRRLSHLLARREQLFVFSTSGTSGQGQELHAQTMDEARMGSEVYAHMYRWSGLKRGDQVFLTMMVTMLAGGRLEYHGAVDYGLTVLPIGNYDAQRKLELLRQFPSAGIVGTTSYFGHLSAVAKDLPPAPGMKALYCGGEGAAISWYERLDSEWQARVYDRYGSTQSRNDHMFSCSHGVGSAARPGMLHNVDEYVLVEVVDPATGRHVPDGERGEVVLTSLYHTDTPVIRCRMRDLAVYRPGRYCPCGLAYRGIEIGSIGRLDNMYRIKGVNVWPQAVEQVMFEFPEVDEYQVDLTSAADGADIATIRFMPKTPLAESERGAAVARIADELRQRIGLRFVLEPVAQGALARSEYKAKRWRDERAYISQAARDARKTTAL